MVTAGGRVRTLRSGLREDAFVHARDEDRLEFEAFDAVHRRDAKTRKFGVVGRVTTDFAYVETALRERLLVAFDVGAGAKDNTHFREFDGSRSVAGERLRLFDNPIAFGRKGVGRKDFRRRPVSKRRVARLLGLAALHVVDRSARVDRFGRLADFVRRTVVDAQFLRAPANLNAAARKRYGLHVDTLVRVAHQEKVPFDRRFELRDVERQRAQELQHPGRKVLNFVGDDSAVKPHGVRLAHDPFGKGAGVFDGHQISQLQLRAHFFENRPDVATLRPRQRLSASGARRPEVVARTRAVVREHHLLPFAPVKAFGQIDRGGTPLQCRFPAEFVRGPRFARVGYLKARSVLTHEGCEPCVDIDDLNAVCFDFRAEGLHLESQIEREIFREGRKEDLVLRLPVGQTHEVTRAVKRHDGFTRTRAARHAHGAVPGLFHDVALRGMQEDAPLVEGSIENVAQLLVARDDVEVRGVEPGGAFPFRPATRASRRLPVGFEDALFRFPLKEPRERLVDGLRKVRLARFEIGESGKRPHLGNELQCHPFPQ